MKALSYINGKLTVIRDYDFYTGNLEKPVFITGTYFKYSPAENFQDGVPLTAEQKKYASDYIEAFDFGKFNNEISGYPCVDENGDFIGRRFDTVGYTVVPDEPEGINTHWSFELSAWVKNIVYDKTTKKFKGYEFRLLDLGSNYGYAKNDIPEGYGADDFTYDETTNEWIFELSSYKNAKKKIAKSFFTEYCKNSIIGRDTAWIETVSYYEQEQEAKAYLADNTVATPFIDGLLAGRNIDGETKDSLANLIITHASEFRDAYSLVLGKFQKYVKDVDAASTIEEVDAVGDLILP